MSESNTLSEAEAKLAELRQRREKRDQERAEREKQQELEREIVELEAIEAAEAEYGDIDDAIKIVRSPLGIVIVKKPSSVALKQYHDKGKGTIEAKDRLSRPCVVYPKREEYARMTSGSEGAAIISAVADAACWLGGWGRTAVEGKSES